MTNHPNRQAVYRVQTLNGKFGHARGKDAAIDLAKELIKLQPVLDFPGSNKTWQRVLERDWGVTITRVSASVARSVGL
jgi:hypothetical protein